MIVAASPSHRSQTGTLRAYSRTVQARALATATNTEIKTTVRPGMAKRARVYRNGETWVPDRSRRSGPRHYLYLGRPSVARRGPRPGPDGSGANERHAPA